MFEARADRWRVTGMAWVAATLFLVGAAERGVQLRLEVPDSALEVGEASTLVIELIDAAGQPQPARGELEITIETEGGLVDRAELRLASGESRLEVPVRPEVPGAWYIQVLGQGLFPASGLVVAVAPDSVETTKKDAVRQQEERAARELEAVESSETNLPTSTSADRPRSGRESAVPAAEEPQPAPPIFEPAAPEGNSAPVRPASRITDRSVVEERTELSGPRPDWTRELRRRVSQQNSELAAVSEESESEESESEEVGDHGSLVLRPPTADVRRGPDGFYRAKVHALWFVGEVPRKLPEDLDLFFLFDPQTSDRSTEPEATYIPRGAIKASTEIRSKTAGDVEVVAMYDRGISQPARLRFLPPKPVRVAFTKNSYQVQSLAAADLDLSIQLLDITGGVVMADRDTEVVVSWSGKEGASSERLTIPAEQFEAAATVTLSRFGNYSLEAVAAGLAKGAAGVDLELDFLALLLAMVGGSLGTLARLLFVHRDNKWRKGIWRSLLLGSIAAILVLLLAVFQVLSAVEQGLPAQLGALVGDLPFANQLAILLLGLVAGLGLESIFLRFTGGPQKAT